jgi:hypothetical protein
MTSVIVQDERTTTDQSSMATTAPQTPVLLRWLTGLAVGIASGLLPLVLGVFGILLALPGLGWAGFARPRGIPLSGFLAGLGGTWLVVWGRAIQACGGANTATDGCVGPDLSGWSIVPIAVLVLAGLIAAVTGLRRS